MGAFNGPCCSRGGQIQWSVHRGARTLPPPPWLAAKCSTLSQHMSSPCFRGFKSHKSLVCIFRGRHKCTVKGRAVCRQGVLLIHLVCVFNGPSFRPEMLLERSRWPVVTPAPSSYFFSVDLTMLADLAKPFFLTLPTVSVSMTMTQACCLALCLQRPTNKHPAKDHFPA